MTELNNDMPLCMCVCVCVCVCETELNNDMPLCVCVCVCVFMIELNNDMLIQAVVKISDLFCFHFLCVL